jgi:hypothetical protein
MHKKLWDTYLQHADKPKMVVTAKSKLDQLEAQAWNKLQKTLTESETIWPPAAMLKMRRDAWDEYNKKLDELFAKYGTERAEEKRSFAAQKIREKYPNFEFK